MDFIHPDHEPALDCGEGCFTFSIEQIERATWTRADDRLDVLRIHPTEVGSLAAVEPLRNGRFVVFIGPDGERLDGEHASARTARFIAIAHLVATARAAELEIIRKKPIIDLTSSEMDRLDPEERRRAISFLARVPAAPWPHAKSMQGGAS